MLYNICYVFLLFIIYAILGWIVEVLSFIIEDKKLVNRGFLIGPYCPIYGVGLLLIVHFLKRYTSSIIIVFVMCTFICVVLEYFTSYIMEKLFNARWWDYSQRKYNINGRVCLENTIPFGFGGTFVIYVVDPFIKKLLNMLSNNYLIVLGIILMTIFLVDLIVSLVTILKVKNIKIDKLKDNTEEINKKVREYLIKKSVFTRRLIESFPNFKVNIINIKNKIVRKKNN